MEHQSSRTALRQPSSNLLPPSEGQRNLTLTASSFRLAAANDSGFGYDCTSLYSHFLRRDKLRCYPLVAEAFANYSNFEGRYQGSRSDFEFITVT
jgi:hypothetical protein